jgi:hypothetical protein
MNVFSRLISSVLGLNIIPTAGDLASPANGDIWYNSTTGKFRKRENGTTTDLDTGGSYNYGMNYVMSQIKTYLI